MATNLIDVKYYRLKTSEFVAVVESK